MQQTICQILREAGAPLSFDELRAAAGDDAAFVPALDRLMAEHAVLETKKHKLALPEQLGLVRGTVQGTLRGFGFLCPGDGTPDIFLPPDAMAGAMHGDEAYARVTSVPGDPRPAGEIAFVTRRRYESVVGTFEKGLVAPDERRLPASIRITGTHAAQDGDKVVVAITQYPDGRKALAGRIVEVLGRAGDPGVDVLSIVRSCGIRDTFPEDVQKAAAKIPDHVQEDAFVGREDWRGRLTVTIDGRDSKDYDDAVSLERLPGGGFRLGVHIADVSHYAIENGALDREARTRGTSVYFADRVIPMLPEALSNGICSLNEGVDRLTLSCIMDVDANGGVTASHIAETVIRSQKRLVYDDVTAFLTGAETEFSPDAALAEMLRDLETLQKTLAEKRTARGSVDFDLPEPQFGFDERGRSVSLQRAERGIANRIIEECMLLANETVAARMHALDAPFLYRVHGAPDADRMRELARFFATLGLSIPNAAAPAPRDVQKAVKDAAGTPAEAVANQLLLRAMQRARYSETCAPHFGLASPAYCHFTSPIRRYPDLWDHRIIKLWLHGALTDARTEKLRAELPALAGAVSTSERVAADAERAVDQAKTCEYMQREIGNSFDGVISGVTAAGLYVTLPNTAEGFLRLDAIPGDDYAPSERDYGVRGRRSGRLLRLGDPIRVLVNTVDLKSYIIDLLIRPDYGKMTHQNRPNEGRDRHAAKTRTKGARAKSKGKARLFHRKHR